MRVLTKLLYSVLIIYFIHKIFSIIGDWNTIETYTVIKFEMKKHYYLILQLLVALSFASSLIKMIHEDKNKKEI